MIKKLLIIVVLSLCAVGWVHLMAQEIDWLGNKKDTTPAAGGATWTDDSKVKAEITSLHRNGFHLTLTVKVTHPDGKFIGSLSEKGFEVTEDGEPVTKARFVSAGQAPLQVCVCIDYSNSMGVPPRRPKIDGAKKAALAMLDLLRDHTDHLGLYFFNETFFKDLAMERLPLAVLNPNHRKKAKELLEAIKVEELDWGTPMYAAMDEAIARLKSTTGRRVMIVLTDGMDTHAKTPEGKARRIKTLGDASEKEGIPIYMISVGRGKIDEEGMKEMAKAGGGRHIHTPTGDQLKAIFVAIGETLKNEYVLEWDSPNPIEDGSTRKVVVTARHGPSGTESSTRYTVPGVLPVGGVKRPSKPPTTDTVEQPQDTGESSTTLVESVFWPLGGFLAVAFVVPYFCWLRTRTRPATGA